MCQSLLGLHCRHRWTLICSLLGDWSGKSRPWSIYNLPNGSHTFLVTTNVWSILKQSKVKNAKTFLHQLGIPSDLQFHICKDQGLWQIQVDYHFSYSSRPIVKLGLIFIEKLGAHSYKKAMPSIQYQIRTIYPYSLLDLLILSWIDLKLKSGVGGYPLVLYETGLSSGTVPTLLPKEAKEQSTNKSLSF